MSEKPDIFTRMGGTRALADILGEPPSTVQSWKTSGRIPSGKQPEVIAKAAAAGHVITAEDVVWPFGRPAAQQEAA